MNRPVEAKVLERKEITKTTFRPETVTITPVQRIRIRGLFQAAGLPPVEKDKATSTGIPLNHKQRARERHPEQATQTPTTGKPKVSPSYEGEI